MKKKSLEGAENAIKKLAERDEVSVEYVRTQMKIAMINGLCSEDPVQKAYWKSIPCEGEIPTPEEFIAYTAKVVKKQMKREE